MGASLIWIFTLFLKHYSIIHKGIVPFPRIGSIEGLFYQGENFGILDIRLIMKKAVDKYPPYIRLNKNRRFMKCKGRNCRSGRFTYSGKSY